jgi:hypothetical protein
MSIPESLNVLRDYMQDSLAVLLQIALDQLHSEYSNAPRDIAMSARVFVDRTQPEPVLLRLKLSTDRGWREGVVPLGKGGSERADKLLVDLLSGLMLLYTLEERKE